MTKLERRLLGRDRKRFQGLGPRDLELRVLPSAGIEMASTSTKSRAKAGFGQAPGSVPRLLCLLVPRISQHCVLQSGTRASIP